MPMYCVCAFSIHQESPDMILVDKPLVLEVVLSHIRIPIPFSSHFPLSVVDRPYFSHLNS
jgi:hypothetical protein